MGAPQVASKLRNVQSRLLGAPSRRYAGLVVSLVSLAVAGFGTSTVLSFQPVMAVGTVLANSGAAAAPLSRPHPSGFFEGWFVSRTTGWMVIHEASSAALSRTDDGGTHWQTQLPLEYPKLFQRDMSFIDANTGFVAAGVYGNNNVESRLFATSDGGSHWVARSLPGYGAVGGLDFTNARTGWVLQTTPAGMSTVSRSEDGGSTWTPCQISASGKNLFTADNSVHLEGVRFADQKRGWIGGWKTAGADAGQALYYYTNDGCATWKALPLVRLHQDLANESVWFVDPPEVASGGLTGLVVSENESTHAFVTSSFTNLAGTSSWRETRSDPSFDLSQATSTPSTSQPASVKAVGVQVIDPNFSVAEATTADGATVLVTTTARGTKSSTRLSALRNASGPNSSMAGPMAAALFDNYCWDYGCNNLDPQLQGCSTPNTKTVYTINGYYPYSYNDDLRYDPANCGANWGRSTSIVPSPPGCSSGCPTGVKFESTYGASEANPHIIPGNWIDYSWPPPNHWTNMYSGYSSHDRVCRPDNSGICTLWG